MYIIFVEHKTVEKHYKQVTSKLKQGCIGSSKLVTAMPQSLPTKQKKDSITLVIIGIVFCVIPLIFDTQIVKGLDCKPDDKVLAIICLSMIIVFTGAISILGYKKIKNPKPLLTW